MQHIDVAAVYTQISDEFLSFGSLSAEQQAAANSLNESDNKYIDEFKKLYNSTISRLDADDFYFFDDEYYKKFIEIFKGKGFLGCIKKEDDHFIHPLFWGT